MLSELLQFVPVNDPVTVIVGIWMLFAGMGMFLTQK